jgi:hypothetical protein
MIEIQLDRKHKVHRDGDRWAVTRLQDTGQYDLVEAWDGNRRSLMRWLETNNIHPTREAESRLYQLPERRGFREDEE